MNSKQKREEIVALIDNIKEHSDRLSNMPHMPLLEVSAILSKINRLHESTVVLKYLLATEQHHEDEEFGLRLPKMEIEEEEEELEEEEEVPLEAKLEEDLESIEDFDEDGEQDDDLEINQNEIDLRSDFADVDPVQTATQTAKQVDIETLEEENGMSSKVDINEQYADEQEDRSLSEQLKKQPIADLMAAIGLNERYLYANDLFGGDIEEFRKVIRLLNDFGTENEATQYFNMELRRTYGWDDDNELAEALYLLVCRRFQNNN